MHISCVACVYKKKDWYNKIMKIAIDTSPIEGKSSLQHRVRGTGFLYKKLN